MFSFGKPFKEKERYHGNIEVSERNMYERACNHLYYDPCFFLFVLLLGFCIGWSIYGLI